MTRELLRVQSRYKILQAMYDWDAGLLAWQFLAFGVILTCVGECGHAARSSALEHNSESASCPSEEARLPRDAVSESRAVETLQQVNASIT